MEIFPNLPTILYHVVFSTKDQAPLITAEIEGLLYSYLDGLVRSHDGLIVESGGMPDHIHLLANFSPEKSLDEMIAAIKSGSADWLNENVDLAAPFAWQESWAGFTVSQTSAPELIDYLRNQAEIHRDKTFKEEFVELLEENGIDDYNEDELWE